MMKLPLQNLTFTLHKFTFSCEITRCLRNFCKYGESLVESFKMLDTFPTTVLHCRAAENARKKRRAENGSGEPKKFTKAAPKPNPKIISGLHDLFTSTCKLFLAPTGLRYFVAIDLKSLSPTDKCYRCSHVSPAQAGVLTTLCLLHADRNVSVCVAGAREELVPVELSASMTVQQGVKKLEEVIQFILP